MPSGTGKETEDMALVRYTAKQLASSLLQQIAMASQHSSATMQRWRMDISKAHFHDDSSSQIAYNDVQAIELFNAITGEAIPIPDMATQFYNAHYHSSNYDGGFLSGGGAGIHDHRDVLNGGFAFAVYHPGTALPQQPWAI